jgi:hypothetical protein
MRVNYITCLLATALCLVALPAAAQQQKADAGFDEQMKQIVSSQFLTVACDVPQIQPLVPALRRSVTATDASALIDKFFGSRDNLLGDEKIISPLWGPGTRYKSGMVLRLVTNKEFGQRSIIGPTTDTEVVPVFLDVYPNGFLYVNNVPHTAVHATKVKETSAETADISYYDMYSADDGQVAAEKLVAELMGELKAPAGCQTSVKALIQHFGERLYAYRIIPEYITKCDLLDEKGNVTGSQPMAVPIYDSYVHVQLDGDKMLAGIEYFWDGGLSAAGEPKRCLYAPEAVIKAREGLLKAYDNKPPLLTVASIKLGYIQDRNDKSKLIPAWLFDAWYAVLSDPKKKPNTTLEGTERVEIPLPFAVNALDGTVLFL